MRAWTLMMAAGLCAAALQAPAQELEEHKAVQPKLSLRLSDAVIEKAVRETLAEQKGKLGTPSGKTLSGDAYQKFERAFSEAEKPDCLHPDAMKFQPHSLQFKILGQTYGMGVGGLLALPFWGAAIVRGKCN